MHRLILLAIFATATAVWAQEPVPEDEAVTESETESIGELSEEELLRAADGGLWIGWLDQVECFEPSRVQIRAHARGVRRIREGKLAEGLPDLIWEDSLLRAFSNLLGVGSEPVVRISHDRVLGGISTPALAIADTSNFRPLLEEL